ncbi:Protein W06D4.2, partial [Aphelenchoides avenae]
MLLAEVGRRYVEQLETTTETMRRRCLALYDGSCNVGNRALKLANQARDVVEPMAYDLRDQVDNAVNDMQPLDPKDTTSRHSLIELYF